LPRDQAQYDHSQPANLSRQRGPLFQFGQPQGRSHTFTTAQTNQTPNAYDSFFVYVIQDYQLVTITNLLIEQTKTNE
jgi:hypothetical protein